MRFYVRRTTGFITSEFLDARHSAPLVLVLHHGDVATRDVLYSAVQQGVYVLFGCGEARTMESRGTLTTTITRAAVTGTVRSGAGATGHVGSSLRQGAGTRTS